MFHTIFYTLLFLAAISLQRTVGEHDEDNWIEPNAWGRDAPGWKRSVMQENDLPNSCPVCESNRALVEDGVALIYYKKFIANLFHRQKLQFNDGDSLYQRSLLFTLLPAQLEKLEQLSDPRDLDSVLTEIIATARTIDMFGSNVDSSMGITALVWDIVKDSFELLKISEIQFILIVAAVILLCWFLHNRYQIGYIRMGFISLFFFGFFFTYLECNRKLEIDEIIEYITDVQPSDKSWYSRIIFWKSNENVQVKQLKKSKNLKMPFCRPDHVLLMYFNDLFMKQFEFLIEKFTATTSSFTSNLSFPYNLMAPILLFSLIGYVLKLTYKYILSPRAWASLLHANQPQQPHAQQQQLPHNASQAISEDRISGENLKILLNAIKTPNILVANVNSASTPAASGVQDILEQIESKSDSQNKSIEPAVDNNNSVHSKEKYVAVSSDSVPDSQDLANEK